MGAGDRAQRGTAEGDQGPRPTMAGASLPPAADPLRLEGLLRDLAVRLTPPHRRLMLLIVGLGILAWAIDRLIPAGATVARIEPAGPPPPGVVSPSGLVLLGVPAGVFTVGCTLGQGETCPSDEGPAHPVRLSRALWMSQEPVSRALVETLLGRPASGERRGRCAAPTCPAHVALEDALRVANALSIAEGLEPCFSVGAATAEWPEGPACRGYRLPTEAEWEIAARGGEDLSTPGGAPLGRPDPGTPNGYGLLGLGFGVGEWVWGEDHAYDDGEQLDPTGVGPWGRTAVIWLGVRSRPVRGASPAGGGPARVSDRAVEARAEPHPFRLVRSLP